MKIEIMIQEDYCSHELTKLLLEKDCPLEKVRRQDGRPVYYTLPKDHPNWADCDAYYIPTHAQVMKWLREKYAIHTAINRVIHLKDAPLKPLVPPTYEASIQLFSVNENYIILEKNRNLRRSSRDCFKICT